MNCKRFTALFLVLLLFLQFVPTMAFATIKPAVPYYVAIGDSIAGGYGLRGDSIQQLEADSLFLDNVVHNSAETCYPRLVANAIAKATTGAAKASDRDFANLGALGYAVTDFYYAFSETDPQKLANYVSPFWETVVPQLSAVLHPGQDINWENYRWADDIVSEIKKADLITFNVGANDVMQPLWEKMTTHENPLIMLMGYLLKLATLEVDLTKMDLGAAIKNIAASGTKKIDLQKIISGINIKTIGECLSFFDTKNLSSIMVESVSSIRETYGETLEKLRKINPHAKIVLVGTHNPYGNSSEYHGVNYTLEQIIRQLEKDLTDGVPGISCQLSDGIQYVLLHNLLGKTAQPALDILNDITEKAADDYNFPFVYTMDKVENAARIAVHPKEAQHEQIANAIIDVLLPLITCDGHTEKIPSLVCGSLYWIVHAQRQFVKRLSAAYWLCLWHIK